VRANETTRNPEETSMTEKTRSHLIEIAF